ncbi:helix-turn-helix domain-containing protein [Thalassospira lucentensis]|uniref:helix-turn-helix domain-containing protein n=1 Tax=Thalassospira lucentensis TaxID=168935 RepID=UPI003AA7FE28
MVISLESFSPEQSARNVGVAAKQLRLSRNLTRKDLASRAGVPVPTLRKFEDTGLAPFLTVMRLAHALSRDAVLGEIFAPADNLPNSIDEMLETENTKPRQRARRKT